LHAGNRIARTKNNEAETKAILRTPDFKN
jgi:hypothetical protein